MAKPSLADMPEMDDAAPMTGGDDAPTSDGAQALAQFLDDIGITPPEDIETAFKDFQALMALV